MQGIFASDKPGVQSTLYQWLHSAWGRIPVLLLLFAYPGFYEARHLVSLSDYDIWWHLRTGAWILQNHAVPRHALFTQYSDRPWMAYSWGFEVLAASFYHFFGLRGIPILQICLKVGTAVVAFLLARGTLRSFWPAAVLAGVAQYAITDLKGRPASLSIILLGIELILLFEARRSGNPRKLRWLLPLFVVWANSHIQFTYGIFVLALFVAALLADMLRRRLGKRDQDHPVAVLSAAYVAMVATGCVLATLLTPYTYHTYQIAWGYVHSKAATDYIMEMRSMNFRWPQHFARLLLVMAACFATGCRGTRDLFAIALLAASACIGFHQQRDTWFMVLVATAVIGDAYSVQRAVSTSDRREWRFEAAITALSLTVLLVAAVIHYIPSDRQALLDKVGEVFPVKACDAIRRDHLPPSIFNSLNWGGFLIWYLPEYPVSIDGRTDLYGDDIVIRQDAVWSGELPVWREPTLVHARTLILGRNSSLAAALDESPGYQLVYQDQIAAVYERMVGPDIPDR